jgi:hypothetical protein
MAILVLLLTACVIVIAMFGLTYFCYKLATIKRDKYLKFDEDNGGIELAKTGGVLAKIDEIPEEDG